MSPDSPVKLPAHVFMWLPFPPQCTTESESWRSLSCSFIPGLLLDKAGLCCFQQGNKLPAGVEQTSLYKCHPVGSMSYKIILCSFFNWINFCEERLNYFTPQC